MDTKSALSLLNGETKLSPALQAKIKQWTDVYYGMSLHTTGAKPRFKSLEKRGWIYPHGYYGEEYQKIFENILFSRHPRENEETRWWRFSQYKDRTRAPFLQIIEVITGAIFQDSNWAIDIPNEKDKDYILDGNNFDGNDLINWYAQVGIPSIMEDPNGLIVRMPSRPYYQQVSGNVDVKMIFVNSKDIIYISDEEVIFKLDGYAYHIDKKTIFRFQYDETAKKYFLHKDDANGYYAHLFDKLPISVAGGRWNTQKFYDSFLVKAKAVADDFVSSYSAEQMIDKESSHPFITMADEECPTCNGLGTHQVPVTDENRIGEFELKECSTCHGKKTISVSPGDRISAPKEDMAHELIKITNPDININKYHHEKNTNVYELLLQALNLYKTDKAESGAAKAIDQERLYQFISSVANHLFDKHIFASLTDIIAYRNTSSTGGVMRPSIYSFSITKPTSYQIKTASDLLAEFKEGRESGMPVFVRGKMALDFVDKQYSGDQIMKKKADIILEMDDVSLMGAEEQLTMSTIGVISKEDIIFSRKLPPILDAIIREKGEVWFLNADYLTIKAQVDSKFVAFKAPDPYFNASETLLPVNP